MRSRKAAVKEAIRLFEEHNGMRWHIGIVAIRQLLDFIYDDTPLCDDEELTRGRVDKGGCKPKGVTHE